MLEGEVKSVIKLKIQALLDEEVRRLSDESVPDWGSFKEKRGRIKAFKEALAAVDEGYSTVMR